MVRCSVCRQLKGRGCKCGGWVMVIGIGITVRSVGRSFWGKSFWGAEKRLQSERTKRVAVCWLLVNIFTFIGAQIHLWPRFFKAPPSHYKSCLYLKLVERVAVTSKQKSLDRCTCCDVDESRGRQKILLMPSWVLICAYSRKAYRKSGRLIIQQAKGISSLCGCSCCS